MATVPDKANYLIVGNPRPPCKTMTGGPMVNWLVGHPAHSETTNPGGYGTVTLCSGRSNLYRRLKRRIIKPKPITMHVGWEDEHGEFHEEASWRV